MSPALRQTVRERAGERCEYCRRCIPKLSVGCVTERGCVVLDQPQQLANLLRLVRRKQPCSDGNSTVNLGMH